MRRVISLAVAFEISVSLFGQSLNKIKLDSLFDVLSGANKAMGSVAISKKGKIAYRRSIGYSSYGEGQNILSSEKTKYRIGSVTKIFTATLIFQLIEEKKIRLSTTIDKFFP